MISISSTLFNPTGKLKIQLSVGLNNDEFKNFVNVYENSKGVYISINPNIVIVMKYVISGKEWVRQDNVYINERNIYTLNMGLNDFYKKLMRENTFIYNNKGYVDGINWSDQGVIPLTKGQFLQLEPTILYDKRGEPYPGVMLRINVKANEVDLSLDEYEAMMHMFQSVRIREEGMLLLQLYLAIRKNPLKIEGAPKSSKATVTNGKSIFDRTSS